MSLIPRLLLITYSVGSLLSSCSYQRKIDAVAISLNPIYQNNMVLHTEVQTILEGQANANGVLAVQIGAHYKLVEADEKGCWKAIFPELNTRDPFTIRVQGKDTSIVLSHVLPGKWVAVLGDGEHHPLYAFDAVESDLAGLENLKLFSVHPQVGTSIRHDAARWKDVNKQTLLKKELSALQKALKYSTDYDGSVGVIDLTWPKASLPEWIHTEQESVISDSLLQQQLNFNSTLRDTILFLKDNQRDGVKRGAVRLWYDTDSWKALSLPVNMGKQAFQEQRHVSYLRKKITIPERYITSHFTIDIQQVHGEAECFVNGMPVTPYKMDGALTLNVPDSLLRNWTNVLAIRFFSSDTSSGIYGQNFSCYNQDSTFYTSIAEGWKYTTQMEDAFPVYDLQVGERGFLYLSMLKPYINLPFEALVWSDSHTISSDSLMISEIQGQFTQVKSCY